MGHSWIPEDGGRLEREMQKQMGGCMAGFLQIFDRNQILTGKRLYGPKRLPSISPKTPETNTRESQVVPEKVGVPEPEKTPPPSTTNSSPLVARVTPENARAPPVSRAQSIPEPAPDCDAGSKKPPPNRDVLPLPLPLFDFTNNASKPSHRLREGPRLSLDSRATLAHKGGLEIRTVHVSPNYKIDDGEQRRSPSVVARLMGLDAMPDSGAQVPVPSLRRSASETRARKDPTQMDGCYGTLPKSECWSIPIQPRKAPESPPETRRTMSSPPPPPPEIRRKIPDTGRKPADEAAPWHVRNKKGGTCEEIQFPYGEVERRLRLRGIDDPSRDLETLKHILEALRLKGLLHSGGRTGRPSVLNFVTDRRVSPEKPATETTGRKSLPNRGFPASTDVRIRKIRTEVPVSGNSPAYGSRRNPGDEMGLSARRSPRKGPKGRVNAPVSPPGSTRRSEKVEASRRNGDARVSPGRTAKADRPIGRMNNSAGDLGGRSPRNRRKAGDVCQVEVASTESSRSASSLIESEVYKKGRSLLERCDKLLQSIAEVTAEPQPSPVSVLDSSFYKEEDGSPSPVGKRSIDFNISDVEPTEEEDDNANSTNLPHLSTQELQDYLYISQILQATGLLQNSSKCPSQTDQSLTPDLFDCLEGQRHQKHDPTSTLHRRLVFDTVSDIFNKRQRQAPWESFSGRRKPAGKWLFRQVWSEFRRLQKRGPRDEDECEAVCSALFKDAGEVEREWTVYSSELSDAVLDMERLIFKDLVGETIGELAVLVGGRTRRQLCFG
ncbi:hypothetical protein AMTRI_Chr03g148090 [Amborella trichopoda]